MGVGFERLEKVREKALEEFWAVVAEEFKGEVRTGDFPLECEVHEAGATRRMIRDWLMWNLDCPPDCENDDEGTCPRCFEEGGGGGCPHGVICADCLEECA